MAVEDGAQGGGEVIDGVHVVHLAGLDERGDDGPVLGPGVVACKEGVLAVQGNHPFTLPMSVRNWRFITAGILILVTRFAFGALSNGRQASFSRSWAQQASS